MEQTILLIGYGNTLRGDDGAGPRLAEAVAAMHLPQIRVLISHGIVPEMAEDLNRADHVLFVDACRGLDVVAARRFSPNEVAAECGCLGHAADPVGLLTLTQSLFGRRPEAWLLLLPAENFAMGEHLSTAALTGIDAGLQWFRGWMATAGTL